MTLNKRGVALSVTMMLVFILVVLGSAILIQSLNQRTSAERAAKTSKAFWKSEAGFQNVLNNIVNINCKNARACSTPAECSTCLSSLTQCTNCYDCSTYGMCMTGTYVSDGSYGGFVSDNSSSDYSISLTDLSNDYSDGGNTTSGTLTVVGYYPDRSSSTAFKRKIYANITFEKPFHYAILANNHINVRDRMGGATGYNIDSYNSNVGAYAGLTGCTNGCDETYVHSNISSGEAIRTHDDTRVNSHLSSVTGSTIRNDSKNFIGDENITSDTVTPEPIVIPQTLIDCSTNCTHMAPFEVHGGDSISLSGNIKVDAGLEYSIRTYSVSTINITDDTAMYVEGSFILGPQCNLFVAPGKELTIYMGDQIFYARGYTYVGQTSSNPEPAKVKILSQRVNTIDWDDSQSLVNKGIRFGVGADIYASISCPTCNIDSDSYSDFWGAVIGRDVDMGGGCNFHYDQAIANEFYPYNLTITNWQEQLPQSSD